MNTMLRLQVNGIDVDVPAGANVAAAIARVTPGFRHSPGGAMRGPLCGMGVCFECRVTIDGEAHRLACLTPARNGMQVQTGD